MTESSTQATSFIKDFMDKLPPGLQSLSDDLKSQLRQCLQKSLEKLSLVTREEFDIQTQVLAKTRAKLEHLEEIIERSQINPKDNHQTG